MRGLQLRPSWQAGSNKPAEDLSVRGLKIRSFGAPAGQAGGRKNIVNKHQVPCQDLHPKPVIKINNMLKYIK